MVEPTFTDIRGKQYETVDSRVRRFRADHLAGVISTELIHIDQTSVLCKASVMIEGNLIATGVAEEMRGSSNINQTSAVENCETSAVGRALGFAGYDAAGSIATADEVARAISQQSSSQSQSGASSSSPKRSFSSADGEVLPAGKTTVTLAGPVEPEEIKKKDGSGSFTKYKFNSTLGHTFETMKKDVANKIEMARRDGKDITFEHDDGAYRSHKIKPWTVEAVDPAAEAEPEVEAVVEEPAMVDNIPF